MGPEIAYVVALMITLWASHDITKKSEVIIIDKGQIVNSVKVKSPSRIMIFRDGDNIEVRAAKRNEFRKKKE